MDTLPWYRQPWPWFIMAIPALAVVGGIVTTVLAVRSNDGVVAADYYRRGLAINEQLSRHEHARQLGIALDLTIDGRSVGDRIRLRVAARETLPADATVKLRLIHPGRADADRIVVLARTGRADDGRAAHFVGHLPEDLPSGDAVHRQWSVEAGSWRVDGTTDWHGAGATARATAR